MKSHSMHIFAPCRPKRNTDPVRVFMANISMRDSWLQYAEYVYARGVDTKLNRIEEHRWWAGSQTPETLLRAPRLVHFSDVTGCRPIAPDRKYGTPRSHHPIREITHCDHTTYWLGPNGEPLLLTEPYRKAKDIELDIKQRQLNAIVLPHPGIYAGEKNSTCSVLMGLPQHADLLREIADKLEGILWPSIGIVVEMNWSDALALSKAQREVCDE